MNTKNNINLNIKIIKNSITHTKDYLNFLEDRLIELNFLNSKTPQLINPVCKMCSDTHNIFSEERAVEHMCTYCPIPCNECRSKPQGPYCDETPCDCDCHKKIINNVK